jgi:DNA-binding response OmpR family regulator/class 3 adenylate cyclase/tetratricopeptide (TPR) repeat protein
MKQKVLIFSGVAELRATLARILQAAGYAIELSSSTRRTRELLAAGSFDAAIATVSSADAKQRETIDFIRNVVAHVILLVDDLDATSLAHRIFPGVPVLGRPMDVSALLSSLAEALVSSSRSKNADVPSELLAFDAGVVDFSARTFHAPDGPEISLTRAEFQLLAVFLKTPGKVLSRDQLRDAVGGRGAEAYDRSIDMLVARLRRKIEPDPKAPRFVVTVAGVGYRFTQRPRHVEPGARAQSEAKLAAADQEHLSSQVVAYFERRQMTVLACQLMGFGRIAAKYDPEDVDAASRHVILAVEEFVKPFGGKTVVAPGDSLLIYFGYPRAQENDAERAVRCALRLVRAAPGFDAGLGIQLNFRIGIATGIMLVGGVEAARYPAVGEAVNIALSLRSAAPKDGVVVAGRTHELLGRFFDCQEMDPVAVDGQTARAWHVRHEVAAVRSRFDGLRRADMLDLVGRIEERDLLLQRWERAKHGSGQTVMITGEPGIGKSRLLAELEHTVLAEGPPRLKYCGLPHHTDASMYTIISELQYSCGLEQNDTAEVKIAKLETALREQGIEDLQRIGLLADLLSLPSEAANTIAHLSPAERKKEIFAALHGRIKNFATRQSPVIFIEDIQWIDPASLEFLSQLVERSVALPILIVIASRPGFAAAWLGYAHVTIIELPRLGKSDAELLLARVAGKKKVPKDIALHILEPAEGVPLFIEELTKTVLEIGVSNEGKDNYEFNVGDIHTIPSTLHGSLLARLDRLGTAKEVAQIGAVIGREFSYELLTAVAAMPEQLLRSALDRLVASRLIFSRGVPPIATYMFKHALVRDAAYGMLLRDRRNELHETIARTLEGRFAEIAEAQPELLAHHYGEANSTIMAVRYLSIAGERALSRSALDEAHKHFTRALKLVVKLPDNDSRRRDELKLLIGLARTLLEQKGYADLAVGTAYATASRLSEGVNDLGMRLAIHYGLWAHHYIGGKPAAMLLQADEFLELAKQQEKPGPILTGNRLVGTAHLINGNIESAVTALDRSLEQYVAAEHGPTSQSGIELRSSFGQDVGVTIHSYRAWARWLAGWPDQAADAASKAEQFGRESGHMHSLFYALWHAGMTNILLRNQSEVGRLGGELTRYANERELPYWQALGHFLEGWHATRCGRPADAITRLRSGLELWEQRGSRVFRPICTALLAEAYFANGEIELARANLESALQVGRETGERWAEPDILRLHAELLAGGKDPSPKLAIAQLKQAIELARHQGSRSLELRATMSLARIITRDGRSQRTFERLAKIYHTFSEGLSTADLMEVKSVLATAKMQ